MVGIETILAIRGKKRELRIERLEILGRYDMTTVKELEEKIKDNTVPEHPAWEDLIEVKNVEVEIKEIVAMVSSTISQ
jgi:hypothetical protein